MNIVFGILLIYLGVGLLGLLLLELITHRITNKINKASIDTRGRLASTGNLISMGTAKTITISALILFWPVAIYGALTKENKKEKVESPIKKRINKMLDYDLRNLNPMKSKDKKENSDGQ
jgi:hypothetical protein